MGPFEHAAAVENKRPQNHVLLSPPYSRGEAWHYGNAVYPHPDRIGDGLHPVQ